jgi:hypothetical protein
LKVFLVYNGKIDLPDELRIFSSEKAAKQYANALLKAGIRDPLLVTEPVESSGNIEYEIQDTEEKPIKAKKVKKEKPKPEIVHRKVSPPAPPAPRPIPAPAPPPAPPVKREPRQTQLPEPEPEKSPEESNRERLTEQCEKLPLFIRNPRVIDMVGRENADLVDWESLDTDNHETMNTYRGKQILGELKMFE